MITKQEAISATIDLSELASDMCDSGEDKATLKQIAKLENIIRKYIEGAK